MNNPKHHLLNARRINGHGHILPEPEQVPQFMRKKKLFWIDSEKKFMHQGTWKRPITDSSFFLHDKLAWMDKHRIDHAVMLNLSQIYCNGWAQQETRDAIRWQNDFNASLQHDYPDKFTTGFVVQPRYIDDALREIERCVALGLQLLCLPTHFLNAQEQWVSVADESVYPVFELADRYGLAIEIHPYDGQKMIRLQDESWRFHLVWMMAQTADTLHLLTLNNLPGKFPRVRFCFAHGCMLGQANYGRRVQGFNGRPDLFEGKTSPEATKAHPNLFFDTLVHDAYTLQLLVNRVGVPQIVAGLDDPYPLGEMETVKNSYPFKVLDDAQQLNIITEEEKHQIWKQNIIRWLWGE